MAKVIKLKMNSIILFLEKKEHKVILIIFLRRGWVYVNTIFSEKL